jgi:hypothetical protein
MQDAICRYENAFLGARLRGDEDCDTVTPKIRCDGINWQGNGECKTPYVLAGGVFGL